jgi:hypothetical protein
MIPAYKSRNHVLRCAGLPSKFRSYAADQYFPAFIKLVGSSACSEKISIHLHTVSLKYILILSSDLHLREEHSLRISENRVLMIIFVSKKG